MNLMTHNRNINCYLMRNSNWSVDGKYYGNILSWHTNMCSQVWAAHGPKPAHFPGNSSGSISHGHSGIRHCLLCGKSLFRKARLHYRWKPGEEKCEYLQEGKSFCMDLNNTCLLSDLAVGADSFWSQQYLWSFLQGLCCEYSSLQECSAGKHRWKDSGKLIFMPQCTYLS